MKNMCGNLNIENSYHRVGYEMELKQQIERTRTKMIEAGQLFGYTAPETLALSVELDQLINSFMGVKNHG